MKITPAIPLFVPDFGPEEERAVRDVLRSRWITMGPRVEALERRFAEVLGARHAVAVASGTAALHLAYLLVGVGPNDEVVVPSLTFVATVSAVRTTGAAAVFADIAGHDDWTIDPADVARRITPRTRAVVAMHYGGHPCDMAALAEVCRSAGVALVEDAAHALGGRLDGRALGTFAEVGCFSLYSNKVMTTGEGGMLVTDREDLAARARLLRSHGMTATAVDRRRGARGYDVVEPGFNYRMDDLRAAVGLAQMDRLDGLLARRHALVSRYRERLAEIPGVCLPEYGGRGEPAHYILAVALEAADRDAVRARLAEAGVETSVHYPPVHRLHPYRREGVRLPHTEWVGAQAITLPLYPSLSEADVDRVCEALAGAVAAEG